MADDFLAKFSNSPSVRSLQAEQRASAILARLRWTCHQGAFYRDEKEGKLREIDVVARQMWKRGRAHKEQIVRLNLILEAKSARDWHLVFAGGQREKRAGHTTRVWSGHLGHDSYVWLREVLRLNHVPEEVMPDLIARFEAQAFPDDCALLADLFTEPPHAGVTATAFRETNVEKEKDLESSVLWRAMSALRSATSSLGEGVRSWHADIFKLSSPKPYSWTNLQAEFDLACQESVRYVDTFHPIILIDSHLWLSREGRQPRRITTCRFYQLSAIGGVEWWCDIVHSSVFEQFARELSGFYARFFRQQGARMSAMGKILER
jgi:hypothetical protein